MPCNSLVQSLILAMLALLPSLASAFNYATCRGQPVAWGTDLVDVRADVTGFPAGSPQLQSLATAVSRINLNPSRFRYQLRQDTGGVGFANGQSEVWFVEHGFLPDESVAVALNQTRCFAWPFKEVVARLVETDIVIDVAPQDIDSWSTSERKSTLMEYGGDGWSLSAVLLHELGHGLGLRHNNIEYNPMLGLADGIPQPDGVGGQRHLSTNGRWARAYLGEDASAGTVFLYGARTPIVRDVGVVHFTFVSGSTAGVGGVRPARIEKAVLRERRGQFYYPLPSYANHGETRFYVRPGQTVQTEFTFENNGVPLESNVGVRFVISSNDYISTGDRLIRQTWMDLSPHDAYIRKHEVVIPSDLAPGKYALGVIIDPDNEILEVANFNNATYIPIEVCSQEQGCEPKPQPFPG